MMNTAQIDLENLFSDPKNMPEFIPDYSIDEIDKALNDALAEINQNQESILGEHNSNIFSKKRHAEQQLGNENYKFIKNDPSFELELDVKPLSPESLHSDTSLVNSPSHDEQKPQRQQHQVINTTTTTQPSPQFALQQQTEAQTQVSDLSNHLQKQQEQFQLQKQTYENQSQKDSETIKRLEGLLYESQLNFKNLENKFELKTKDYEYLIKELHKSELKRMELMDENNHLKKCVTSLAFK